MHSIRCGLLLGWRWGTKVMGMGTVIWGQSGRGQNLRSGVGIGMISIPVHVSKIGCHDNVPWGIKKITTDRSKFCQLLQIWLRPVRYVEIIGLTEITENITQIEYQQITSPPRLRFAQSGWLIRFKLMQILTASFCGLAFMLQGHDSFD